MILKIKAYSSITSQCECVCFLSQDVLCCAGVFTKILFPHFVDCECVSMEAIMLSDVVVRVDLLSILGPGDTGTGTTMNNAHQFGFITLTGMKNGLKRSRNGKIILYQLHLLQKKVISICHICDSKNAQK